MKAALSCTIRDEEPVDLAAIRALNEEAFRQDAEANIVDELRRTCPDILSLVAERGGRVVGHILFSPVTTELPGGLLRGMGLAPMAVLPSFQRQGIGSRLVAAGLERLRQTDCPFVVVIGHPEYYPRFGFRRASEYGLVCQWDEVPDEAVMVTVFDERRMRGIAGMVRYREEFDAAM